MKKGFYFGVGLIVIFIGCLLAYGIYLNERSENQITLRMSERRLPLHGAKVTMRNIYPVFEIDIINFYSNEMIDVNSLIEGKVQRHLAAQNDFVREGDAISELVNEDIPLQIIQADSDILEAEANLARAQNTYNRYSQLVELDAISKQKFDEAKADFESAKARLKNANAKREQLSLRSARQIVTAPISGEIIRFYKPVGSYVTAGSPVALIGNFDTLYFTCDISNAYWQPIEGLPVEVKFSDTEPFDKVYGTNFSAGNLGDAQTFNARLVETAPPISQPADVRKFTWAVDNSSGLLEPGLYHSGEIHSKIARNCLTVPRVAVVDDAEDGVYIVKDDVLQFRHVVVGIGDSDFVEVISGLNEGDIVVTSATEGLSEGLKVEVTLDEEAH